MMHVGSYNFVFATELPITFTSVMWVCYSLRENGPGLYQCHKKATLSLANWLLKPKQSFIKCPTNWLWQCVKQSLVHESYSSDHISICHLYIAFLNKLFISVGLAKVTGCWAKGGQMTLHPRQGTLLCWKSFLRWPLRSCFMCTIHLISFGFVPDRSSIVEV